MNVYTDLRQNGYPESLCLDANRPKTLKISRDVPGNIIKKIKKNTSLTIKIGNGSTGNKGLNNRGYLTEKKFYERIINYKNGTQDNLLSKMFSANTVKDVHLTGMENMRPRGFNAYTMMVGDGPADIGKNISDIVVKCSKEIHYISLKYSSNFDYANFYVKPIFNSKVKDVRYYNILNTLGIDIPHFEKIFNEYQPAPTKGAVPKLIDIHSPYDKVKVENFLGSVWGHGYWNVNLNEQNHESCEYIDISKNNLLSKIDRYAIAYPLNFNAKRVDIWVQTPAKVYSINLRNKNGDLLPDRLSINSSTISAFEKFLTSPYNVYKET